MKKLKFIVIFSLIFAVGLYFWKQGNVTTHDSTDLTSEDQTPGGKIKSPEFVYKNGVGVLKNPLPKEDVLSGFPEGIYLDGIQVDVRLQDIQVFFQNGQTFEMPFIGGGTVTIIPRDVYQNEAAGSVTFVGETKSEKSDVNGKMINETNFHFFKGEFTSGEVRINGELFPIKEGVGKPGFFLLKLSPNAKIDR